VARALRETIRGGVETTLLYEDDLTDVGTLSVHATEAKVVEWKGRRALKLVDGLALVPGLEVRDVSVEVFIGAEGNAYPGVAFRTADVANYELVYAVPHCSGLWDAVQYDPVFHGSNTWQLYHGPSYQQEAQVPTNEWFRLRVDAKGDRAMFSVGEQPPLVVGRLARGRRAGMVGIWTFKPAYFSQLKISPCRQLPEASWQPPSGPDGAIDEWFVEGLGVMSCEPGGVLNVNRYLPASEGEVHLMRQFEVLSPGELELRMGFSDELSLELDGEVVFEGSNTFTGFADYEARGYAYVGQHAVRRTVSRGVHRLTARLKVTELFGWGLVVAVERQEVRWLPAALG
jgi:hypothetical protein